MGLILCKGQGIKARSNEVTKSKCCMIVVQHMFYGALGTQNSIVTFISKFGPRKGQCQVIIGQIRLNFQIHNFLTKTCLCSSVCPSMPKIFICFYVCTTIRNAKNRVSKSGVITFTCFYSALAFCTNAE